MFMQQQYLPFLWNVLFDSCFPALLDSVMRNNKIISLSLREIPFCCGFPEDSVFPTPFFLQTLNKFGQASNEKEWEALHLKVKWDSLTLLN